jgi:hypothetical protein
MGCRKIMLRENFGQDKYCQPITMGQRTYYVLPDYKEHPFSLKPRRGGHMNVKMRKYKKRYWCECPERTGRLGAGWCRDKVGGEAGGFPHQLA